LSGLRPGGLLAFGPLGILAGLLAFANKAFFEKTLRFGECESAGDPRGEGRKKK